MEGRRQVRKKNRGVSQAWLMGFLCCATLERWVQSPVLRPDSPITYTSAGSLASAKLLLIYTRPREVRIKCLAFSSEQVEAGEELAPRKEQL